MSFLVLEKESEIWTYGIIWFKYICNILKRDIYQNRALPELIFKKGNKEDIRNYRFLDLLLVVLAKIKIIQTTLRLMSIEIL